MHSNDLSLSRTLTTPTQKNTPIQTTQNKAPPTSPSSSRPRASRPPSAWCPAGSTTPSRASSWRPPSASTPPARSVNQPTNLGPCLECLYVPTRLLVLQLNLSPSNTHKNTHLRRTRSWWATRPSTGPPPRSTPPSSASWAPTSGTTIFPPYRWLHAHVPIDVKGRLTQPSILSQPHRPGGGAQVRAQHGAPRRGCVHSIQNMKATRSDSGD